MSEEIENDLKIKKIANETFERLFKLLSEKDEEIERLHSIIKEVREYIENNTKEGPIQDKKYFYSPEQANDILEILDKVKE